ncbi:MAG: MATE family efflux transporter [Candidatus Thermoplasmatota archaeon]|nr:MATE family efflux transporter [Candidatus Thermoplasmatota archaeon]
MTVESEQGTDAGENKFANSRTSGVETLLGDPKKAILKLSIPMIIAMSVQTAYNVADALWVSFLGPDALAAVGLFFPFFFILIAIATGIGVGAGAALSRRIGAKDKEGSDNVAMHSLLMMMGTSLVMVVIFLPLTRPMFAAMGASGDVLDMTVQYSQIMFAIAPLLFFMNWATAIMRSEGDVMRPMLAMTAGSILNIVLDPIFIFTLDMGVAGAAWASAVAIAVTALPLIYWMFIKADTYVTIQRCCFTYSRDIVKDIMRVGLPATVMQLSMSITMLFLNFIIIDIGGTDGVAIFTTGWRVVMVAILPLIGIATAIVSVTGAAFGARQYEKIGVALNYSIKMGFIVEVGIAAVTFVLAGPIAAVFSTGEGGERIQGELENLIRILAFFYPFVAFGMFSSSMFQGTGKGMNALVVTLLRTVVFTMAIVLVLAYAMDMDLNGVWWGMVLGNTMGAIVAFVWARYYLSQLKGESEQVGPPSLLPD